MTIWLNQVVEHLTGADMYWILDQSSHIFAQSSISPTQITPLQLLNSTSESLMQA
jgi:hypothetical protein